jgi:hypothetical protein
MEDGGCMIEDGVWKMEDGGLQLPEQTRRGSWLRPEALHDWPPPSGENACCSFKLLKIVFL